MKISVIIPCLNAANTITQQLDALANQSVQPWEVIVSDNGSTDATRDIADQYAAKFSQFRIVDASLRKGASHARNIGAAAATGDYFAFCDADDIVAQGWLAALQNAFAEHSFLASRFDYKLLNDVVDNSNQDTELQNFRIPFLPFAGGCGLAIRRDLHEAVSGFDESILYLEDVDYCIRLQLLGETLTFVPEALIHIRYSSNPDTNFFSTRKACYRHAYNWGAGMAKLYGKYHDQGMELHGIAPRLVLVPLWMLRAIFTVFDYKSIERIGWHVGVLQELIQLRLSSAGLLQGKSAWSSGNLKSAEN
ncbi:MAG: glycosyltransferase [Oculatellaceae cyanobacterium Prado106]|nr:glycosyltransferase [Oculatellaceae cyanobacterium Prado106]